VSAAVILILCSLALLGAIAALIGLFIVRETQRSDESAADRAYRWREEMRAKSHDRQYR
jgi:hypothetical protein